MYHDSPPFGSVNPFNITSIGPGTNCCIFSSPPVPINRNTDPWDPDPSGPFGIHPANHRTGCIESWPYRPWSGLGGLW